MKIALVLYGYFNNREDQNSGMKGYAYIQENLLKHGVDVFIHSWDLQNQNLIEALYNPKMIIVEEQIDYTRIAGENGLYQADIDENFNRESTIFKYCTIQQSLSFYHSRAKGLMLKREYERDFNLKFKYDVVITARFDLGHRSEVHRGYNVSEIRFDPNLDMNYLYSSMWMQLNCGFADQWFYSSSENMDKFIYMGDKALVDFKLYSHYHHLLINGWPDSNEDDEFSNEVLKSKEEKAINLVKYPTWQIINNHLYHKYFIKSVGLYENSKFI